MRAGKVKQLNFVESSQTDMMKNYKILIIIDCFVGSFVKLLNQSNSQLIVSDIDEGVEKMIHSNTAAGDCEHKFLLDVVVCPGYVAVASSMLIVSSRSRRWLVAPSVNHHWRQLLYTVLYCSVQVAEVTILCRH